MFTSERAFLSQFEEVKSIFRPALCMLLALTAFALLPSLSLASLETPKDQPIVSPDTVIEITGGLGTVEAEHFYKQTLTSERSFNITSSMHRPWFTSDGDPVHLAGASNGAYIESLPDTRRTHADKLIPGENFTNEPGKIAVLHYKVNVSEPGRYYVWVRAYATGSEDNGLHVGLDGKWLASGQRMQWCGGKNTWRWESKQRTAKNHCGEPYKIYLDIQQPGLHEVKFSMREDGFEFDKWILTKQKFDKRPKGLGAASVVASGPEPESIEPRGEDGDGSIEVTGELKQWHKVTLSLQGPYANENYNDPNPFLGYRMDVCFTHESGTPDYLVPGYFAADGDAANSSAGAGTVWRAHLSPDKAGKWTYKVNFYRGEQAALEVGNHEAYSPFHSKTGSFEVGATDKTGRDLRGQGRLGYVGKRYLQFAGSNKYFLKVGADAPETLLGYADFDGTIARKKNVPLKTYAAHVQDWQAGDPTWKQGKGKGLIGAVNYLSSKGCNAFSFIPYNAGGDGDNVWPMVAYNDKLHYDCSKLDQWQIVFDHATACGMYLHFKLQETENDDLRGDGQRKLDVPTALDNGRLGVQRKLYCREIVARFAHELALNWNLGEENTQTVEEQRAMADYLRELDPYDHHIVIHTYPDQQDSVYGPLLGPDSVFTGASLQNSHIKDTHWQSVKWVRKSDEADKPWIVAFDESGSAAHGQPPDLGYQGFDGHDNTGKMIYTQHEVRRQTLWGNLMGGGAGVEYYFGYQFAQNDLKCEDWRSRDQSWDDCRRAIEFFHNNAVPFWEMEPADHLVGNTKNDNSCYCLAKPGEVYVVYAPNGKPAALDLQSANGSFHVKWYNPRKGGKLLSGSIQKVDSGQGVDLGSPPSDSNEDWAILIRNNAGE